MDSDQSLTKKSKQLSWLLRHGAADEGLSVDPAGWVPVRQVLDALRLSMEELRYVVAHNNKQRLQLEETRVRACQGHSEAMPVTLEALEASWEVYPDDAPLWHGTTLAAIEGIAQDGLLPVKRTHVHLAPSRDSLVGKRHNTPVLLEVSPERIREAGQGIYQAQNGVVLVQSVPPRCIVRAHATSKTARRNIDEINRRFREPNSD